MKIRLITLVTSVTLLSACAVSPLKQVWTPAASERIAFDKALVVVVSPSQTQRRIAEDTLAGEFNTLQAQASYQAVPADKESDMAEAKQLVKANGFDGAIVMKYLGTRQKITTQPAAPAPGFWGYYAHGFAYRGDTINVRDVQKVEINVYSLKDDRLLWSGVSEITEPRDIAASVKTIAQAVKQEWQTRGLL